MCLRTSTGVKLFLINCDDDGGNTTPRNTINAFIGHLIPIQ